MYKKYVGLVIFKGKCAEVLRVIYNSLVFAREFSIYVEACVGVFLLV